MSITPATRIAPELVRGYPAGHVLLGCDYNPEQWSRDVWRDDIALMRELGVDLVAINIFGWAQLEKQPGEYDFSALDEIIGLLHDAGIRLNLGTGTSSPPPWLSRIEPSILPVDADGITAWPGGRQAWCPSSPVFREHALALVERVAERYGEHPALALWHVSNELGCHNAHCYCDTSAHAFRRWLETRYGTIDALNDAWGTAFWSQRYSQWGDILPPRRTRSAGNPAHNLDFRRFSSDALLDYYRAERTVIGQHSSAPITTNLMVTAHIQTQDYWGWTADLDLIANDHYLDHRLGDPLAELAFSADLTRGLADGGPWMLMETSTSAVSWQPVNHTKSSSELQLTALTHVARGADSICFFQWRQSQRGAEKFHSALLPHGGTASTGWQASVALSSTLDRLDEVVGSRVEARAAMVVGWQQWWAAEGESHPTSLLRYLDEAHRYHRALRALGVTVDMVRPGDDLTEYALVVLPTFYAPSDADVQAVTRAVTAGTSIVVTPFSGIADETDAIRLGGYPGAFRDLLGITIDELRPLADGATVRLASGDEATIWTDSIRLTGAEAHDHFATGPAAGSPAITRRTHGDATAWYVGTVLADNALARLLAEVCESASVPVAEVGPDADLVVRRGPHARYTFVINHGARPVTSPTGGVDLLSGDTVTAGTTVAPGTAIVVRESLSDEEAKENR
ncbi:MAG: beta-galactosidase [Microcella sp.]